MKICFFVADITFKGGIERVLSNLTNALLTLKPDLDITIVSQYRTFSKPNYKFNDNISIKYLSDKSYSGSPGSFHRVINHVKNIANVRKFFKKNKFDIISSQSFTNTFILYLAGLSLKNVIVVEHVYYGYYGSLLRKIREFLYPKTLAVSVLTTLDKNYYSKWIKNVLLIPNPIDLSTKQDAPLSSKTIIAIGRLEIQKNFSALINIFSKVNKDFPDWELNIFGEGNLKESLQSQIDFLDLHKKIHLKGTTDNIDKEIRNSSFLVMSSIYEGFGMVLIEALKNGVPCISYDCPAGPSDIIINDLNGLLIPNQDEVEMEYAMRKLIENKHLREQLGKNAYDSIQKFDSKRIADMWLSTFNHFLN